MPLATPTEQHLTTAKKFFCDPNGSDSYDGRSSRFPKATIPAVMALATVTNQGDITLGPASFPVADTIELPMGVRLHGTSWQPSASLGTELVPTGFPDDGRHVILTSNGPTNDFTKGLIENIRITGPSTFTDDGAGLGLRNVQNGAIIRNVQITGMPRGAYLYTTTGNNNFPAYTKLDQVWAANCLRGFEIEMGTCITRLVDCAVDYNAGGGGFLGAVLITSSDYQSASPTAITVATSSGYTATITSTAHGRTAGQYIEVRGVTPTAYNGLYRVASVPTADTLTYVTSTANIANGSAFGEVALKNGGERGEIILDGLKGEHNGTGVIGVEMRTNGRLIASGCSMRLSSLGTQAAFSYTGPRYSDTGQGTLLTEPPVTLRECQSQNHAYAFTAPQFGIVEPAITASGQTHYINWPKKSRIAPPHSARPAAAGRENFPRLGAAMTAQAILSSGRLNYVAIELRAGEIVSSISFYSQSQAAVSPTNQWFVLMDSGRNVVAKTVDDTTTAWAAPAKKTLAIATDAADAPIAFYKVPADGLYFVGICVVAGTVPQLLGVAGGSTLSEEDPNMSAPSSTGLTNPASCPDTPIAGTAIGGQPYCFVS